MRLSNAGFERVCQASKAYMSSSTSATDVKVVTATLLGHGGTTSAKSPIRGTATMPFVIQEPRSLSLAR